MPFGINNPVDNNGDRQSLHLLTDLGVSWVSDSVSRKAIETIQGVYENWEETDRMVHEYADTLGLKVLFVINPLTVWDREVLASSAFSSRPPG